MAAACSMTSRWQAGSPVSPPRHSGRAGLTETGTHAQIDAAVDGACCGEPELAIRLATSAAGMLVIMDRGFPGVALWRAYTGAGAHLLIRARSCVAARPIEYLPDGTYLARMNLAGQKRAAPGHVVLRVIEYQVDGGEVIRLLTDLPGPRGIPGGIARGPLPRKVGGGVVLPPDQDVPARAAADPALRQPRTGLPGSVGAPGRLPLPDQDHHGAGRRRPNRPGPHLFLKVLKHVRRSVIARTVTTAAKMADFMDTLASRVDRKLDSGPRRPRVSDRLLKRQNSKYSYRDKGQLLRPTRRAPARTITLHPAILQ
jgi:hypothetical protein